jgi:hypothetical protein
LERRHKEQQEEETAAPLPAYLSQASSFPLQPSQLPQFRLTPPPATTVTLPISSSSPAASVVVSTAAVSSIVSSPPPPVSAGCVTAAAEVSASFTPSTAPVSRSVQEGGKFILGILRTVCSIKNCSGSVRFRFRSPRPENLSALTRCGSAALNLHFFVSRSRVSNRLMITVPAK